MMVEVFPQVLDRSVWFAAQTRLGLREIVYDVAFQSDVGQKRIENQDVAEVFPFQGGLLCVVCDGMGGYSGGEVASRMAVDTIIHYFRQLPLSALSAPFNRLQEAIQWANRKIWEYAQQHPETSKMGTTVVAALCYKGKAYIAHVGDSRLYLLREGSLLRVTRDHSRVQRLVDEGKIRPEDAEHHPSSNLISRVLGQFPNVDVECQQMPIVLTEGDKLLLCSDGLVGMVEEKDILLQLSEKTRPEEDCKQLVERANHAGGKDNITVLVTACHSQVHWLGMGLFALYVSVLLGLFLFPSLLPASRSSIHNIEYKRILPPKHTIKRSLSKRVFPRKNKNKSLQQKPSSVLFLPTASLPKENKRIKRRKTKPHRTVRKRRKKYRRTFRRRRKRRRYNRRRRYRRRSRYRRRRRRKHRRSWRRKRR